MSVMPASTFVGRISDRLGLPDLRTHPALVVALAVDAVGSGVAGPLLLLYLIRVAGLPLSTAGLLLTVSTAVSLIVPAVAGRISQRVDARVVVVAAQFLQALAMIGLLVGYRHLLVLGCAAMIGALGQRAFWSSVFIGRRRCRSRARGTS